MKQSNSFFHRALLTICCLCVFGNLWSQYNNSASHYLGFSVAGGLDFALPLNTIASAKPGGEGKAALHYELQKNRFFFNLTLGAELQNTALFADSVFVERQATDIAAEEHIYQYRLYNMQDRHNAVNALIGLGFGYRLHENVYAQLGISFKASLWGKHKASTELQTAGLYDRWEADYIADIPTYGFYPRSEFIFSGASSQTNLWATPSLEIGGMWNIGKSNVLKVGVYADYNIRLNKSELSLIDYSATDLNPVSQSEQNLRDKLVINSMTEAVIPSLKDGHIISYAAPSAASNQLHNIAVGLRLTLLFNVKGSPMPCRCYE
ncbi:MAG: hypothetical protein IJ650_00610 [Paludibacteraceae bacterium]|nr:hypothetical protein [Paludibacteraceae bacterium]